MIQTCRSMAAIPGVILLVVAWCAGCEGGGQGMNVRLSPAERVDIDAAAVAGTVRIPDETAFNLTSYKSGQEGLGARGEAQRVDARGAVCTAQVNGTGSAWGEFQTGYCFDNTAGKPLQAVIKLSATVLESASKKVGPVAGDDAGGQVALTFFVKDTVGLVLRQEPLATTDLSKGARTTTNRHEMVFDITCEPGRGYYIVVAGRASANARGESSSASTRLEISGVSFQVEWHPADGAASSEKPTPAAAATAGS